MSLDELKARAERDGVDSLSLEERLRVIAGMTAEQRRQRAIELGYKPDYDWADWVLAESKGGEEEAAAPDSPRAPHGSGTPESHATRDHESRKDRDTTGEAARSSRSSVALDDPPPGPFAREKSRRRRPSP